MDELRQSSTPLGVLKETLDERIIINENREEADYHTLQPIKHFSKNPCRVTRNIRQKTLKRTFQFELNSHFDEV